MCCRLVVHVRLHFFGFDDGFIFRFKLGLDYCFLFTNVNGPAGSVRRLYYGVWELVVLYAALVWAKVVEIKKNRNILKRA